MKHYIISQTQLEWINTMIGETRWNFLGLQKLPELKRLSDEELNKLWADYGLDGPIPADGPTPYTFAWSIMDKLGVPE